MIIKEDIKAHNPGTIVFYADTYKYLDQIDGKTLISGNFISAYLKKTYDLTTQEYYNLVMYGGVNNTPLCYKCGSPREFIKISHGYKVRCKNCLDKCHKPKDAKVYDKNSKAYKESISSKKRVETGTHNFQTQSKRSRLIAQINSAKNTFINRAKLRGVTEAYFYIGWTSSYNVKIGITFVGLSRRFKALKLKSIHLLGVSSPENVAELEHKLKLNFIEDLINSNEEFDKSLINKLIKFIKENRNF